MRKLLNTLFVVSEDSYLSLEDQNIVISRGEEVAGKFPLLTLEGIVYFGYRGASPALMGACAEEGISLCFFSPSGRFLAKIGGPIRGNVLLRKTQVRVSDHPEASCTIARNMILGKVYNSRWVLERATRDHPQRIDALQVKGVSAQLAQALEPIGICTGKDTLRGLEGEAAARYFSVLNHLVLQNQEAFAFAGRNRRPPTDPFNALLSFVYTLLSQDCAAALESVGLDPYIGFLHGDRPGRPSLALDLMEELRSVLADRFVLTLINNRIVQPRHFQRRENGAIRMVDDARKAVLGAWQERKRDELLHPFLGEKIKWGLVPYAQALLLARHLRGDLDAYPPFLWK